MTKQIYIYGFYFDKKLLKDVPYSYGFDVIEENEKFYLIKEKNRKRKVFKKTMKTYRGMRQYYLEVPKSHLKKIKEISKIRKSLKKLASF